MNEKKEGHTARFFRSLLPSKVKHGFRMQRMPAPVEVDPCHLEKILVVDDDAIMLKTMTMKLESQGYSVVTAADGAEAIKRVREEGPDLILLDVLFPPDVGGVPWDGISLLRWMRNLEQSTKVPVILVTSDGLRYRDRALASGAAGIFSKPVDYERLLPFMRRILEGRGNSDSNGNFQI